MRFAYFRLTLMLSFRFRFQQGIHPGLVKTEMLDGSGAGPNAFDGIPHIQSEDIADALMFALSARGNVQVSPRIVIFSVN